MDKEKIGMTMIHSCVVVLTLIGIVLAFSIDFLLGAFLFCVIGWLTIASFLIR